MKNRYLFALMTVILLGSCSKGKLIPLQQAELVLPGKWNIQSIQLPKYGLGVTYQGYTFIADTVIFDVGSIEIPDFSTDTLNSHNHDHGKIRFPLTIGNEIFPYSINMLSVSGDDVFSQFRYDGPEGVDTIVTQGEQFIWSSYVFNNNYIINISDIDNIDLRKANDLDSHIITLKRK